jgi:hypothetical protein
MRFIIACLVLPAAVLAQLPTPTPTPTPTLPPILDAFVRSENRGGRAIDSVVSFVIDTFLPPSRKPPVAYNVMYPIYMNPAGYCEVPAFNTTGPVFVASSMQAVFGAGNDSVFALNTSVAAAAEALGGNGTADAVIAAAEQLGTNAEAEAANGAFGSMSVSLACLNWTYSTTLLGIGAVSLLSKPNATAPVSLTGVVSAQSDVVPELLIVGGGCVQVNGSPTPHCQQSVLAAPNAVTSNLQEMAAASQAAASTCDTLQLCATGFGYGLVNVDQCHDSAFFSIRLQATVLNKWTCMYF